MKITRHFLLILLGVLFSSSILAQTTGSNSPYSRYGFGLLNDRAQSFNKGMSGLSYGMQNGAELNMKNPATYGSIDSLAFLFDLGMSIQNANLQQDGKRVNARNAAVDYLSAGFRLTRGLGMSVGLMPYSTIGYNLSQDSKFDPGTGEVTQTDSYSGEGGLHEVYVGLGWRPFKPISIGANVGYLWGDLSHSVLTSFSNTAIKSRRLMYNSDVRTYKVDFGLQYTQPIGKKNAFTLGLVYGLGHKIGSAAYYYDQTVESGTITGSDTLCAAEAYELPHTFGAGLSWNYNNSLRIGADYTLQKWGGVKSPILSRDLNGNKIYTSAVGAYTDMQRITVGAEFVPNRNGVNWSDHLRYSVGFSYGTPYTKVNGMEGPRSYQASLGVAFPIMNRYNNRSLVNVAVQYERIQPSVSNMITENYIRLNVGISFNERWFMKWKVN
jgi:hypothetical protein